MAKTLGELSKQLRQLAVSLPGQANELKKSVASTINFDLLQTTPVDTGLAVSNWQVNLDSPATEPRPAFVPSREGYMKQSDGVKNWTHREDTEQTRQQNIAPALDLAKQVIDTAQVGQPIHITNVLPYIQALDEGHSDQAALFVDRAIILGTDLTSRATLVK